MRLPGSEGGQILLGDEDQGCVGILEDTVDDDVVVREQIGHREDARPGCPPSICSGASGSRPIWMIWVEWIGDPTAATSRLVSTRTSSTPWAFSAVTAPRAVAPNPRTAARSRRP